jgi:hypothetical protein
MHGPTIGLLRLHPATYHDHADDGRGQEKQSCEDLGHLHAEAGDHCITGTSRATTIPPVSF